MADRVKSIKRAQKEALLLREISRLYHEASLDDSRLSGVMINRVELTPDKSVCKVMFYTPDGKKAFDDLMEILILYKPSLRAALAKRISSRYVPDLIFIFDDKFEKEQRIQHLLDSLKKPGDS